jgi:REP element-mobilizing transposase RayT
VPVYLFTFHGYMTWLPDHPRGYTLRGAGYQEPDEKRAEWYRRNAGNVDACLFNDDLMRAVIDEAQTACRHQRLRLHSATTETTHLHYLVSWTDDRDWMTVRKGFKMSLSLRLKREGDQAPSTARTLTVIKLGSAGSRKKVKDRQHFDYLMQTYLPSHSGAKWFEDRGFLPSRKRS